MGHSNRSIFGHGKVIGIVAGVGIAISSCCTCPPEDIRFPVLIKNAVPMPRMNMVIPMVLKKGQLDEIIKEGKERKEKKDGTVVESDRRSDSVRCERGF